MPELPDVEVFKRYLDATALHQRIERVAVLDADLLEGVSVRRLDEALRGRELERTVRHGKFLFASAGKAGWLVLHFGMTGELAYYRGAYEADDATDGMPRHTRVRLDFAQDWHLAYRNVRRLGLVSLTPNQAAFVRERGLGPDPYNEAVDRERFCGLLREHRATVKAVLMNQSVLAGIGNVYADEMLFQTRIAPTRRANALDDAACSVLHAAMARVLREAVEAKADPQAMPTGYLLPHREEGAACPRCGGRIRKERVSGRATYHCPRCQPE